MTRDDEPRSTPKIAVAVPCYNEAAAVGLVVDQFRAALPEAEVVVFDNNSTDATGAIAAEHGARVVFVPRQGKGFVVQEAFRTLADFDVVLMVDGDGTYPPSAARAMLAPVLGGEAETTVGARQPEPGAGAMSPIRASGNLIIRSAFRILIGPGAGDLLSGYRAFSRRFMREVRPESEGFEIETELTIATVALGLPAAEIPISYHPRVAGTESKLRAFRDGRRILAEIVRESFRREPLRAFAALATTLALGAAAGYAAIRGLGG